MYNVQKGLRKFEEPKRFFTELKMVLYHIFETILWFFISFFELFWFFEGSLSLRIPRKRQL